MSDLTSHPKGEQKNGILFPISGPVAVDTFGGRIHVEWNPDACVTPLGQLPFSSSTSSWVGSLTHG